MANSRDGFIGKVSVKQRIDNVDGVFNSISVQFEFALLEIIVTREFYDQTQIGDRWQLRPMWTSREDS